MIPKIIHYCWFGRNPLPEDAKKCIASWRKYFPDYEIKEWNEDNFDVNEIPYTSEAYAAGKYAFVSDYARFKIIYEHGGIYFDTDVEVIKPYDDILDRGPFMGAEIDGNEKKIKHPIVNPGLGIGAENEMPFFKEIINKFSTMSFWKSRDKINKYTMIPMVTEFLINVGMKPNKEIQNLGFITIYPADYFNPLDVSTGNLRLNNTTHSIHWFKASWQASQPKWLKKFKQYIRQIIRLFQ